MDGKRLHVSYIGKQGEQLQIVDKILGFLRISLDLKGKDGTAAVGELLLVQSLLLRIRRNRRMMHSLYLWMVGEILNNLQGILHVALHS